MPLPTFKRLQPMPSLGGPEMSNPMVMNREPQMSEPTPFQAPQMSNPTSFNAPPPQINPSIPQMPNRLPPPTGMTPPIMGNLSSGRPMPKRPMIRPSLGGLRPPNRFGAGKPY